MKSRRPEQSEQSEQEPSKRRATELRVGFLTYDLQPFTCDLLARIDQRLPGRLRAYPLFHGNQATHIPFSYRPSQVQGRFFSVKKAGSTPEGFTSSINWGGAWSFVWENDRLVLFGIQGGTALVATVLATLLRRPLISVNQTLPPKWEAKRRWWVRLLKGWILRRCRIHVAQTPTTRHTLTDIYAIPASLQVEAPFEAGVSLFQQQLQRITTPRNQLRQTSGWSPDTCIFIFVGTLLRFKGVFTIIDAVESLNRYLNQYLNRPPPFKVIFIGSKAGQAGELDLEEYRHHINERGLAEQISFPGPRSREQLAATYLAADVCLLPTQKDCWPKVLAEAAMAGLPLITSDACGAAGSLVRNGETGFVIPPDDAQALAQAMQSLLVPEQRIKMGKQARQTCQTFADPERETNGFLQAIERAK